MKIKPLFLVILSILMSSGCIDTGIKEKQSAVEPDSCKDIPKLQWQIYSRGFDAHEALTLASDLTAAAIADAKKTKEIVDISGKVGGKLTSQLAEIINRNVKQESRVSEEFWEQDLAYRQTLCYLDVLLANKDLTPEQKEKVFAQILAFTDARKEYMFQSEKKKKE